MALSSRHTRRLRWLGLVALLTLTGASVAVAQETELGGKLQTGGQITIAADQTVDGDLYASGGRILVEGTVDGDLIAAAGQVTISGDVSGDLMASAGAVDISGEIGGDARVAAGQTTVSGSIGEDLFIASGQTTISDAGEVGEDLVFGSGRMTMNGTVGGDVLGATGNYDRQGTVAGTENVTIREVEAPTTTDRIVDALQRLISLLLVAALFLWLRPRYVEEPTLMLRQRPWASLGVGFVGVIGFGVVVFLVILVAVLLAIGLALVGLNDLVGSDRVRGFGRDRDAVLSLLPLCCVRCSHLGGYGEHGLLARVGRTSMERHDHRSDPRRGSDFDPRRRWLARAHRHLLRSRCGDTRFAPSENDADDGRTDSCPAVERLDR